MESIIFQTEMHALEKASYFYRCDEFDVLINSIIDSCYGYLPTTELTTYFKKVTEMRHLNTILRCVVNLAFIENWVF